MSNLIRLYCALFFALSCEFSAAGGVFSPCPATGSFHNCYGTYTFSNGNRYTGEWQSNAPRGNGIMYFPNGDIYKGEFGVGATGVYSFRDGRASIEAYWSYDNTLRMKVVGDLRGLDIVGSTSDSTSQSTQVTSTNANTIDIERDRLAVELAESRRKQLQHMSTLEAGRNNEVQNNSSTLNQSDEPKTYLANRRALVIGNDSYRSIPKLQAAREDARTIASSLTAVGYQVTLKLDLTEKEMKAALRNFAAQVQGGDEVMFFFAGHGVQLGAANYLLPTDIVGDSEAQVRDEAIQLQRVLDDMSEKKAKFTLAMIDACRDNPFKTSGRAIGGRGLAPTTAATGQMVIFSAGTGQQALDRLGNSDKNKNGLFTRVFVQEMQKPNVSIDRVVKNVRNQVAELAKSVGHEQVPAIYDQVLGDFYFKK